MTTKTLVKKIQLLEERLGIIERHILLPAAAPLNGDATLAALKKIEGLWAKNPRTKQDLKRLRARLWPKRNYKL